MPALFRSPNFDQARVRRWKTWIYHKICTSLHTVLQKAATLHRPHLFWQLPRCDQWLFVFRPSRDLLNFSVMVSRCSSCCGRKDLIIAFGFTGVVLLVLGLVLSVGGVFSNIIKKKVDQASFLRYCCFSFL